MLEVFDVTAIFVLRIQIIRVKATIVQSRSLPVSTMFGSYALFRFVYLLVFVGYFISCYRIKGFILIFKNTACILWRMEKEKRDPWSSRAVASI